ncbi:MAG: tetratricopeptide repeat protein [bacterium]|nr:tetratricopeptide repeat protein [bacterium]
MSDGLTVAVQVDQFYWVPGNHQFLGDTYHELGEYQKAIVHYQEAIRNLGRSGNLPSWKNLIELALIRTKLAANEQPESRRVGNLIVAQQYLTRAIDIFKECGADGWVERYEKELIASS